MFRNLVKCKYLILILFSSIIITAPTTKVMAPHELLDPTSSVHDCLNDWWFRGAVHGYEVSPEATLPNFDIKKAQCKQMISGQQSLEPTPTDDCDPSIASCPDFPIEEPEPEQPDCDSLTSCNPSDYPDDEVGNENDLCPPPSVCTHNNGYDLADFGKEVGVGVVSGVITAGGLLGAKKIADWYKGAPKLPPTTTPTSTPNIPQAPPGNYVGDTLPKPGTPINFIPVIIWTKDIKDAVDDGLFGPPKKS